MRTSAQTMLTLTATGFMLGMMITTSETAALAQSTAFSYQGRLSDAGGRYNPAGNSWTVVTTAGAPSRLGRNQSRRRPFQRHVQLHSRPRDVSLSETMKQEGS